jgi:chromate reductase
VRLLGISGSLDTGSSNSALLRAAARAHPELTVWEGLGDLPHFSPDRPPGPHVAALRAAVEGADAVLIATPEYAGGMPGSLKNALDWLVGSGELYGKPVVVVSVAPSAERGHNARRWVEQVVTMQGAQVKDSFTVAAARSVDDSTLDEIARQAFARAWGSATTQMGYEQR